MFDIGLGELLVLAVVGLLVFGPERLPKAAADAGRMLRQVRSMAANARQDLADSAGVDLAETIDTVKGLGDLHPRRLASQLLSEESAPSQRPESGPRASAGAPAPAFDPDAT